MDQLATEIIESQKARSDLLKWKVLIVAALSGIGLGLIRREGNDHAADLVLCAVPFACAYVDLLCRQQDLRIAVIGEWRIHRATDPLNPYEVFARAVGRKGAFTLEGLALIASSTTFSFGVVTAALVGDLQHGAAIGASGLIGVAFAIGVEVHFRTRLRRVMHTAEQLAATPLN